MSRRLWPGSMMGQVLLVLALALLLAQGISIALLYGSIAERRNETLVHTAALRLFAATRPGGEMPPTLANGAPADPSPPAFGNAHDHPAFDAPLPFAPEADNLAPRRAQIEPHFAPLATDRRLAPAEAELTRMLTAENLSFANIIVVDRLVADDPVARQRIARRRALFAHRAPAQPDHVIIAALQPRAGGDWLVARVLVTPNEPRHILDRLILQTLLIYLALVGAMALILRRITKPLAALTGRLGQFAQHRTDRSRDDTPLVPQGPKDLRRLITAHNEMEARIVALLDEKDVMLGAIGHDLKTPLSALRVRIEAVEDEGERAKMAATIEDIARSLDDILSLARVGRPSDPREPNEMYALVASVVEEYEDMGEPVTLGEAGRVTLRVRATWLRRALRNLIGNALRYGRIARVTLTQESAGGAGWVAIRIDDDGPGIPPDQIERMLEPFTRGEPSRNSETGGAGLGLTLARAIAEQHGGTLVLANRAGGGLSATLRLPV